MASELELLEALRADMPAKQFVPYCFISEEANALTVYFEADPDYSERLNDHVTLYRSLQTNELVGCRIKGIEGILRDLPNYIDVDHDGIRLSAVFLPFRGSADSKTTEVLNGLAKTVQERKMTIEPCGA